VRSTLLAARAEHDAIVSRHAARARPNLLSDSEQPGTDCVASRAVQFRQSDSCILELSSLTPRNSDLRQLAEIAPTRDCYGSSSPQRNVPYKRS
jgi:hypothetical protein